MRLVRASSILALGGILLANCDGDSGTQASEALVLTCSATPTAGVAPLIVSFLARASGTREGVVFQVNYGDGTTSNEPAGGHVYSGPGSYSARFDARTSGGASATCSVAIAVAPPALLVPSSGNAAPDAVFKTDPFAVAGVITGKAPLDVRFNMCPSVDPDHDLLLFTLDFTSDGILEVQGTTGSDCRRGFTYAAPGNYTATLCVTDVSPTLVPLHRRQCQPIIVTATP